MLQFLTLILSEGRLSSKVFRFHASCFEVPGPSFSGTDNAGNMYPRKESVNHWLAEDSKFVSRFTLGYGSCAGLQGAPLLWQKREVSFWQVAPATLGCRALDERSEPNTVAVTAAPDGTLTELLYII